MIDPRYKRTREEYLRGVRKLPSDDDLKILFFDWGLRYKDIARIYGLNRTQGIDARFRGMGYRKGHWKVPKDETELRDLLADKSKTMAQKAKELGVSHSILYVHAKRLKEEMKLDFNNAEYDEFIRPMRMERKMTSWKIARDLKVSVEFVQFRFKALDIPARFQNQLVVKDPESLRAAIANTELTYKQVADEFGIKRAIVEHYALRWGFRRMKAPTPINDEVLVEKYCTELWSPYRIWTDLGYNRKNVIKRLKELGLFREGEEFWEAQDEKRSRKRGSPYRMQAGYPLVRVPDGHITRMTKRARDTGIQFAHVLEMEKKLGRPLTEHEMIHHIDCNKANFAIDNLCLCKSNTEHMNIHATAEYVIGQMYNAKMIAFRPGYGYYLKKKPKEEDLIDVPEPV